MALLSIFEERRNTFFDMISKDIENFIAILASPSEVYRNNDVHFPFRQDSAFFYLTGFEEPDSIALFTQQGGKREFILFVRPKDKTQEIWNGLRCGVDQATTHYNASQAYSIDEFDLKIQKYFKKMDRIYYGFGRVHHVHKGEQLDTKIQKHINLARVATQKTRSGNIPVYDPYEIIGELRLYKSDSEIQSLRTACKISSHAHIEAMSRTRPGLYEYQLQALLEFNFLNHGCARMGYNPIVASGTNAIVLHYNENRSQVKSNDLILIDAGGEFEFLTADITRTFPASGAFSKSQTDLYSLILEVQKEALRMAKPGATLQGIHDFVVKELVSGLLTLKLLSGDLKDILEKKSYLGFYPHGTSHFLGMDVHDTGVLVKDGEPRIVEPGMVFTIEPGLYDAKQGIGIRIEDDVCITQDGCEVLTAMAPKELDDLRAIIGTKPWYS